ncbi:MAG: outer membrane beta-barrel protein [Nitrospinae bacterium]|nr:outer membrane beta-barrel protein [Nitrospinota bacterium]
MKRVVKGLAALLLGFGLTTPAQAYDVAEGFKISGFVDVDYDYQDRSQLSTFTMEEAEIDIEKSIKDVGGLRVDLNYRSTDRMTAVSASETETTATVPGLADITAEQAFIYANLPAGLKLTVGKFNAPIGFELVDPNQMFQYSHAMVFIYGLPTNLTGAMVSGASGMVDFSVYGVNGWDKISDDNKDKTIGGRLGLTPVEGVNVGLSYITGKEGSDADGASPNNLSAFDIDSTITAIPGLTIGLEYNSGKYEKQSVVNPGKDADWAGYLVMANYAVTEKIGLTLRYDSFDDKEGARFGSGVKEKRDAFTIAPIYTIAPGFVARAEYRYTKSDQKVFVDKDGASNDSVTDIAVDFVYSF